MSEPGYFDNFWDEFSDHEQSTIRHNLNGSMFGPTALKKVKDEVYRILSEHEADEKWNGKHRQQYELLIQKIDEVVRKMPKHRSLDDPWEPSDKPSN